MKYKVIARKDTRRSIKERTFCFSCGCFQGGGKGKDKGFAQL